MRKFVWCRQEVGENCTFDKEHFHVCIATPGGRDITPHCGSKSLNLFFCDLDPEAIRRTEAYAKDPAYGEDIIKDCLTEDQARSIVAFVKATSDNAIFVVNCEAGISRSAGVVLAMRRFYGGDTEEIFQKAHPNVHVSSMVGRFLHE